jgi:DNA invertase Pin-like site-specific DNA recombinase
MKYGYARVSTDDQATALQLAALKRARCSTHDGFLVMGGGHSPHLDRRILSSQRALTNPHKYKLINNLPR